MKIGELISLLSELPQDDELIFATPDEDFPDDEEALHFWILGSKSKEPINFGKLQSDGKRHEWIIFCTWHPLHAPRNVTE